MSSNDDELFGELPIVQALPQILDAVLESRPVVLKAPPGAGKSTGVPPAILEKFGSSSYRVLLAQPRRLATRSVASRIAKEMGCELGREVGYQVRFDNRSRSSTRLTVVTTGILLRRLMSDPLLDNIGCVILDEFHERSLEMDLILGMIQRIRTTLRPELQIVVMSATLEPEPIVEFLGDAISVRSDGKSFPVDVRYVDTIAQRGVESQVAQHLPSVLAQTNGNVLVFLPGVGEIRRTRRAIDGLKLGQSVEVMELFGDLSPNQQDRVLKPSSNRRVILSTNVAETSLTIPGITAVIDSGQARVMTFNPSVGMPALKLESISQASAEQRAGRAGRTSAGTCLRLWPAAMHRARREADLPEIQSTDFSSAMLLLASWGEREPLQFPWLDAPSHSAIQAAKRLLIGLGAIDDSYRVTAIGERMLALPVHPRVARFLVAAEDLGVANRACLAAAILTERSPFRRGRSGKSGERGTGESDVLHRVELMEQYISGRKVSDIENVSAAMQISRVAEQLSGNLDCQPRDRLCMDADEAVLRALWAAYPDRLARRRGRDDCRGVMVGGRGVTLDSTSEVVASELFLCVQVDDGDKEALVRLASKVDPDWLDKELLETTNEYYFERKSESVVARRRTYYHDLMLSESPIECRPGPSVAVELFNEVSVQIGEFLPNDDSKVGQFIARLRFAAGHVDDGSLSALTENELLELVELACQTCTSFSQLRKVDWLGILRSRLAYEQLQLLERLAPESLIVPSGNRIQLRYLEGKLPVLSVRIQELFGWHQTPRVAGGKVPIQLHLLGPNYRPQQITDDLESFWGSTYHQVRKDLRRRYPKHHWPEDPQGATATRNGLKPRP